MAGVTFCAALLALAACSKGGATNRAAAPQDSTASAAGVARPVTPPAQPLSTAVAAGTAVRPAGRRTATATGAGVQAFLNITFAGQRPFQTVSQYLDWLANKPGAAAVSVSTTQATDGAIQAQVVVEASGGQQSAGNCVVGAASVAAHQLTWFDCPQLLALWTAGGPTTFPSVDAARYYLPAHVFMPPSLPGGYQLTSIHLPATPEEVVHYPFVVTADYTGSSASPLRLMEQPAGGGDPIVAGYDTCRGDRQAATPGGGGAPITYGTEPAATPTAARCAAWADKATWFLMTGDRVSEPALQQAAQAVEALQKQS